MSRSSPPLASWLVVIPGSSSPAAVRLSVAVGLSSETGHAQGAVWGALWGFTVMVAVN